MPRKIYVDGIWDLFHRGHVEQFIDLKNLDGEDNYLIVGVISDKDAENYKRKPFYDEKHRKFLVKSCKYVDEVIENAPLILDKDFIDKNNIDLVCHGFSSPEDEKKQEEFFKLPKSLNKFRAVSYHSGISTTQIIQSIRDRKLLVENVKEERVNENITFCITRKDKRKN